MLFRSRLLSGLFGIGGVSTAGFQGAPQIQTPDLLGFLNARANRNQSEKNATIGALGDLGGKAIGGLFGGG